MQVPCTPRRASTEIAPPPNVKDWDRKCISRQNYFTTIGVRIDPGNIAFAIMLTLIRMRVGLEPRLEPTQGPPADWPDGSQKPDFDWS